jgi:RNA polymerase sigma-70 factor, ECF subfamily
MERLSDEKLIKLAISGQQDAYDKLIARYEKRIQCLISRHTEDKFLVKDLSQEVFIRVYQYLHQFKNNSSFYTWLYRITQNTVKNHMRLNAARLNIIEIDFSRVEVGSHHSALRDFDTPELLTMSEEVLSALSCAYKNLSSDLRECIQLYDIDGLTYDQIAKKLNCPVGTVRSRIHRARNQVNESIKSNNN